MLETHAPNRITAAAPPDRAWLVLAILYLVYVSNMADRHILSILAPQIKQEMGLTDAQTGLLIGPAVAFLYAVLGIPLAHIADRVHRVRFVTISLALWSLCTAFGAMAANAWQLAISRLGVSASEAGGIPASTSILGDLFPPHKRALALAIYSTGSTCGIFVSFGLGGYIAHLYGWRIALLSAGLPGLLLALIVLLCIREPARGRLDHHQQRDADGLSVFATIRHILSIRPYRLTLAGAATLNIAIATSLSWGPSYAIRKFGLSSATVGASLGLGIAVVGGLFIILGGWMINRIGTDKLASALRMVAVGQLVSCALFLLLLGAPNFPVALLALSLIYGTMHLYVPAYYVVAQNQVPYQMRASTVAIGVLAMTLMGHGLAPPLVGLLSDLLRPRLGDLSLDAAMAPAMIAILIAALFFRRAAQSVEGEKS